MPSKSLKTKLKQQEFYCVCCRKRVKVPADDICVKVYKNYKIKGGVPALNGICKKCDCNVIKFIKHENKQRMIKKFGKC